MCRTLRWACRSSSDVFRAILPPPPPPGPSVRTKPPVTAAAGHGRWSRPLVTAADRAPFPSHPPACRRRSSRRPPLWLAAPSAPRPHSLHPRPWDRCLAVVLYPLPSGDKAHFRYCATHKERKGPIPRPQVPPAGHQRPPEARRRRRPLLHCRPTVHSWQQSRGGHAPTQAQAQSAAPMFIHTERHGRRCARGRRLPPAGSNPSPRSCSLDSAHAKQTKLGYSTSRLPRLQCCRAVANEPAPPRRGGRRPGIASPRGCGGTGTTARRAAE